MFDAGPFIYEQLYKLKVLFEQNKTSKNSTVKMWSNTFY